MLPVTNETVDDSLEPETSFEVTVTPPAKFLTVADLSVVPGMSASPEIVQVRVSPAVRKLPVTAQPYAIDAAFHDTPTGRVCTKTTFPPPGTELHPQR